MTTLTQAVRQFVKSAGGKVTSAQIKHAVLSEYGDQWKVASLQSELYAAVVNNPKSYIWHPYSEKYLYHHSDGTYEWYSEASHGPNIWEPREGADDTSGIVELEETSISLERDIEDHLVNHLGKVEKGLRFVERQVTTDVGRVDILAEDAKGKRVIIEVKVGEAKDSAIGQIARYMGWYAKTDTKPPRAMLIAAAFPEGVRFAAEAIPNLTLLAYRVHFTFEGVSV